MAIQRKDGLLDRVTDGIVIGREGVRAKSLLLPGAGSGLAEFSRALAPVRVGTLLCDKTMPKCSGCDMR